MGTTVRDHLEDVLEDLTEDQLRRFKFKLNRTSVRKGHGNIPRGSLETGVLALSDLLVNYYTEDYSVEVTVQLLNEINCKAEAKKLLALTGKGTSKPGTLVSGQGSDWWWWPELNPNMTLHQSIKEEEDIDKTEIPEEDPWEIRFCDRCPPEENLAGEIMPEMAWDSQRSLEIYRIHCPEAGSFRCYYSNLIFEVREAVTITYWNDSWNQHLKGEKPSWMIIAGPLFNIQAEPGEAVAAVHLPHFLCLADEDPSQVQIAHFVEEGMSLEKPDSVKPTHVVLKNPTFSLRGVIFRVLSFFKINMRVHAMTLVYQAPDTSPKLHLYLLPNDRSLRKDVDNYERKCKSWKVEKPPGTTRPLTLGSSFCLQSSSDIEEHTFEYLDSDMDQQYFEVYAEQMQKQLVLNLMEKDTNEQVWEANVRQGDLTSFHLHPSEDACSSFPTPLPSTNITSGRNVLTGRQPHISSEQHFIDRHREELIQRVATVEPVLDILYGASILDDEQYQTISSKATSYNQMRVLYRLVPSWDHSCKDKLYEALKAKNQYLIEDLERK
ncbi:NACHT, LRR and PYD domains-containing protein 1b allele 2-like isoform X2 [Hemicordylus capensis]|uniref:NACHT, LRR and PYD domains-containing protein 1b allele 2-like isoform X2 n=1 Tax=Hemicordylus capensis TaxID=884348 RepID=UPI002304B61C|nr:NACHT, LRR and PYD domains-containing protein 1b allele 2-like isoform X2 [Hemicordylus capensis]